MQRNENSEANQGLAVASLFAFDPEAGRIFERFLQTEQGKRVKTALSLYRITIIEANANGPEDFNSICRKGEAKFIKRLFNM